MDQVRLVLRVLWQQRFWLLTSIGTLAATICWMMASGNLDAEFAKKKGEIASRVSNMQQLQQKAVSGNPTVNEKELEQTKLIRDDVRAVWAKLYDAQREKVLQWPDVLGKEFVDYIDKKQFGDPISNQHRETYWNYIKDRFDGLLEIVKAKKVVDPSMMGGGGERPGMAAEMPGAGMVEMGPNGMPIEVDDGHLVEWLDQGKVQQKMTFSSLPGKMQIWVTQEDLWVYQALLGTIAATNESKGATRPDNTAIRAIVSLDVGREAAAMARVGGNVIIQGGAAAGGMGGEFAGGEVMPPGADMMGRGEMGDMGMGMGGEGADPAALEAAMLAGRYVDAAGQPVDAAAEGAQFRRLPVHMTLIMDQRWLPPFLVECANSILPIEVTQVRINPDKSGIGFDAELSGAATGGGGGMGGYGGRGGEMGGGFGGAVFPGGGGRGGGEFSMGASAVDMGSLKNAGLDTVDIQGVVYIYSRPSDEALALPGDEGAEGAAAPADVAVAQP